MKKIVILLLIVFCAAFAKTRWATTRFTPTADFLGAGRLVGNYNIFLNTLHEDKNGVSGYGTGYFTIGISEWVEAQLGYAGGVNFGIKGRILNEYNTNSPSLAVGVRNMFHNETLARSRLVPDSLKNLNEVYLAFGKTAHGFGTRFHAGVLTLPHSDRDKVNGFASVEKYFGDDDDFFLTLEGFSQRRRFYLSLTATMRFGERNNVELFASLLDLERTFITRNRDFGVTLAPRSSDDWVKPGILAGFSIAFGGRTKWIDGQAQFKSLEDNFSHHDSLITRIFAQIDALKADIDSLENENSMLLARKDTTDRMIDSLIAAFDIRESLRDTLPPHYAEIFSRLISYTQAYAATRFDPLEVQRLVAQVRKYGRDGEDVVAKIARNERGRRDLRLRAITMLGELRARSQIPVLLDILGTTVDNREIVEILSSFGKINDRVVEARVRDFLHHNDENIRIAANELLDLWYRVPVTRIVPPQEPFSELLPLKMPQEAEKSGQNSENNTKTDENKENAPLDANNDVFFVEPLE